MAPPVRRRRPSGHKNRKKARARRTTPRRISAVLILANHGYWLAPTRPRLTVLTVETSAALKRVRDDVLACLRRFEVWRDADRRIGDVLEDTVNPDYLGKTHEQEPKETWLEANRAYGVCITTAMGNLQEDDRWRDVYQCVHCRRWFIACHDPNDRTKPYCGPKCWPSQRPNKSPALRYGHRVQHPTSPK